MTVSILICLDIHRVKVLPTLLRHCTGGMISVVEVNKAFRHCIEWILSIVEVNKAFKHCIEWILSIVEVDKTLQ